MTYQERAKKCLETFDGKYVYHDSDLTEESFIDGYIFGCIDQLKMDKAELVHEPDNEEGITSEELAHQSYGAKFGRKEVIDKACEWLYAMLSPIHPIIMRDENDEDMLWKRSAGELVKMFREAMKNTNRNL